jgi:hypothetical protein
LGEVGVNLRIILKLDLKEIGSGYGLDSSGSG